MLLLAKKPPQQEKMTCRFKIGDKIFAKNFHSGPQWIPVKVTKVLGPLAYHIVSDSGNTLKHHVDHLRYQYSDSSTPEQSAEVDTSTRGETPMAAEDPTPAGT